MTRIEAHQIIRRQPRYACRNMARALQMLTWHNTANDWRRLEALRALGYKVTTPIPTNAT